MTTPPVASVVVVTYNARDHLAECLAALDADTASPPFDVWVVDNASPDGTGALALELTAGRPDRHALCNSSNRGYAGGVNTALPHARGEFVAVLNPDCRVTPGWLRPLTELLISQPRIGVACPLILLQADGRLNAAGQDAHLTGLGFNRLMWRPAAAAGAAPAPISGLHGAAFVIRRSVLDQMGGWDDSGFLYHEDVELSWLVQLMGFDVYCQPQSLVTHAYHLTMYPEKLYLLERNRWAMLLTYLRPRTRWLLAPWLLFTEVLMWGYCLLRGPAFMRAKAASYRWLAEQREHLARQRRHVEAVRGRSDEELLRRLRWNYNWDQFFSLGRERGPSTRQPSGGLPVSLPDA